MITTAERLRLEGRAEGRSKGRVEGRAELLLRQLTCRFFFVPPETEAYIRNATIEDLDRWRSRY